MKFKSTLGTALIFLILSQIAFSQTKTDEILIRERMVNELQSNLEITKVDTEIKELLPLLNENGSWSDIDYRVNGPAADWKPAHHFTRILTLVHGYTLTKSSYYNNSDLFNKIEKNLRHWVDLTPSPFASNWWFRGVGIPLNLGAALLILENSTNKKISKEVKEKLYRWIDNDNKMYDHVSSNSGDANKSDYSKILIMIGCIKDSPEIIKQGFNVTKSSIYVGAPHSDGGLLPDNSILFHGRFLYMEGYGRVYFDNVLKFANIAKGTKYQFSAENIAIISNLIRNGYFKTIRGQFSDFNIWGRGISRYGSSKASDFAKSLKTIDLPTYTNYYETVSQRISGLKNASYNAESSHTHFWYTDYSTHQRPDYMVGVRGVSTRTSKTEIGNGENLKAKYFTEGVTFIATNGNEYDGIYPIWDWNKIPGTTNPEANPYSTTNGGFGKTSFVGGVSDGNYGASALSMNDFSTTAQKGWFFFDNEVVCLGAGITSNAPEAINTTVNQTFLKGDISIKKKNENVTKFASNSTTKFNNNIDWVYHDGVGYYFPKGGNITLSSQVQKGSWREINESNPDEIVSSNVFKLYINHNITPKKDSYAYYLIPGVNSEKNIENFDANTIQILENTADIQAVEHTKLNMIQAIFYTKGEFKTKNGLTIYANEPCILLIKNTNQNTFNISVADPSQTLSNVTIAIQKDNKIPEKKQFNLPQGVMKGSSIHGSLNISKKNSVASFYKHCYYNMYFTSLEPGSYTSAELIAAGISIKDISSLKVDEGYLVTLYQEDNFNGKSIIKNCANR